MTRRAGPCTTTAAADSLSRQQPLSCTNTGSQALAQQANPGEQPPPVDHLEQRRVAERGQPPLAPRPRRLLHLIIGGVEERLQLGPGQRPPLRAALMLRDTCAAVFRSWNTCTGTAPARCSHSPTHPYRGSHTYSRNSASAP